jgi:hypothetical protein
LDDFRKIGEFLPWIVFLEMIEAGHIVRLLFSTFRLGYELILPKNGLGYILGDFLTYSSGHPGQVLRFCGRSSLVIRARFLKQNSDTKLDKTELPKFARLRQM